MALRTLVPDTSVHARVAEQVLALRASAPQASDALGGAPLGALGLAAPHPMFNIGLDFIDDAHWLQRVAMTGWRYFITSRSRVVGAAEARSLSPSGPVESVLTNEGPFVLGSETALALAEQSPEMARGAYALGLLRVPALYVTALWLRNEQNNETLDRFLPVEPAPAPLPTDRLLTPDAFIGALRLLKIAKMAGAGAADTN